jgi:lysophospholipase L1-like esterase
MSSASGNFNADAIFYYYADVLVVDTNGDPVSGANVAFTPNSTISAKNRDYTYVQYPGTTQNITDTTTGADGHTPKPYDDSSTVAIVDFKQDVSGKTYYNWTLNVSKSGYVTNDTIVIDPDNSWYRSVASSYQNTTTVVLTSTAQTDDFESYPIGSFNNTGQSNWTVEEGIWQIVSNGTQKLESSVSSRVRYLNYSQRNYNVSADVMFNSSASYVGMFTRWDGSKGTGYLVSCSVAFNTINLYVQKSSNTYAELELESFSFSPYQEYKLKVQMNDSVTTVYIDDVESLNYTDYYRVDTILSEGGYVGFSHVGGSAYFDNFSVITLTENSEYLSYFDYVSANASSVSLAWDLSGHTNATIHRGTNIDVITTEIYHGSATAHVDSGLASDTNYYYTITYDNSTEGHIIKAFTYDLPTTRKYVAIGDSISTDYGALQSNESFPYLLNETIVNNSDSNLTHHISATIGYTTNGIIFGELDDLLTEKPTFITLMAGWNDFYLDHNESDYRANFKYIINESNKHEIDVFVLKMINTSTAKVQSNIDDTNTWIDTLGERYVVDTYDAVDLTPFDGIHQGYNTSYYQDGVHPNLAGTTNLNKSIYGYMVGENYFSGTNIITLYADEYALINNWTANQTYQQIDNNITNAVCYSYYNSTSGLWEAYRAGYTYNHDATIPKNCSVVVFVDSDTTISATPNTGGITITQDEWFYGYLPGSTAKTLTEIETAMDADGLDVWNIYAFNNSSQTYTSTGSYSVAPNEGYAVYCNITGEYTP